MRRLEGTIAMSHIHLSGTRQHLISQLTFFDEQFAIFLDTYFHDYNRARSEMDHLIRAYIEKLEAILGGDDEQLEDALTSIVLLGSSAKLKFAEDGLSETYTVVYPTEADLDQNRISFLSPIGKQLLLAQAEDELEIAGPSGNYQVKIEEIKYAYIGGFQGI